MGNDLPATHTDSPTIGHGSILMLLTLSITFCTVSFWASPPPFDALIMEEGHVQKVWRHSPLSTTVNIKTTSGRNVRCVHDKTGGCDPAAMKSLLASKTPVSVWHDGKKVYKLTTENRTLLTYEHFSQGRWFARAIAFALLVVALIQFGILKGFIGVASKGRSS